MLRTVLLIDRPVVDELIQQAVLARGDDLIGILDSLGVIVRLVCLALLTAGLCPCQVDLGEQCGGGQRGSLAVERGVISGQALTCCQVLHDLFIYLIDGIAGSTLTLTVMQHDRYTAKVTDQVEIRKPAQETSLVDIVLL